MNRPIVAEDVDSTIKLYHWSKWVLGILVVLTITLVAALQFYTLSQVLKGQDQIASCIDPNGQCYKSGDRRQSAAIKTINSSQQSIVVAAAFCAKQPGNITLVQIEDCVNKELAKK